LPPKGYGGERRSLFADHGERLLLLRGRRKIKRGALGKNFGKKERRGKEGRKVRDELGEKRKKLRNQMKASLRKKIH